MQATVIDDTLIDARCLFEQLRREQEQAVTLHVAMVGSDGLVVGSDSLLRYAPDDAIPQRFSTSKHIVSPSESTICFPAGTDSAIALARHIATECDSVSVEQLQQRTGQFATAAPTVSLHSDEVLIVKTSESDAFWLARRNVLSSGTLIRVEEFLCTGVKTPATFLAHHLWRKDRTVNELKRLALLTLSYAAQEEPGSIGPPFRLMTLTKRGIEWSDHEPIDCGDFQRGIETLAFS